MLYFTKNIREKIMGNQSKRLLIYFSVCIFFACFLWPLNWSYSQDLIVTADELNVRSAPGVESIKITTLNRGERIIRIKEENGWVEVRLKNNTQGWVKKNYVTETESNTTPDQWVSVGEGRRYRSVIREISRQAAKMEPLLLDTDADKIKLRESKEGLNKETNRFNSKWEESLLKVQHRLDQAKTDFTLNELKLIMKNQHINMLKFELKTIQNQNQSYRDIIKRLNDNLQKAKETQRLIYHNFRKYYVVLGWIRTPLTQVRESTQAKLFQNAYDKSVDAAGQKGIDEYIRGIEELNKEGYNINIQTKRSSIEYRLAESIKMVAYNRDEDVGQVANFFVLTPICIQPKQEENIKEQNTPQALNANDIQGWVVYDPAMEETIQDNDLNGLLQPLKQEDRNTCKQSLQDFITLIKQYYNKNDRRSWFDRCKKFGSELVNIRKQITKYKDKIKSNDEKIVKLGEELAHDGSIYSELETQKIKLARDVDTVNDQWKHIILHREVCHLHEHTAPVDQNIVQNKIWQNMAEHIFSKALRASASNFRDSTSKYVYRGKAEEYMMYKNIREKPSLIKRYKIIATGKRGGEISENYLAVAFQFDLRLPEKYLVPTGKFDDAIVTAKTDKFFDSNGNLQYIVYENMVWKVPAGKRYQWKTWNDANRECAQANQNSLYGINNWRLPSKKELENIKKGGKEKCCLLDDLGIKCGSLFWTGERAKIEGLGCSYYVEGFGYVSQEENFLSENSAAYHIIVAEKPGAEY